MQSSSNLIHDINPNSLDGSDVWDGLPFYMVGNLEFGGGINNRRHAQSRRWNCHDFSARDFIRQLPTRGHITAKEAVLVVYCKAKPSDSYIVREVLDGAY